MVLNYFIRFLFNPRLVLTELRTEQGGYLSLAAAFLAVATATLGHFLVFNKSAGPLIWIAGSLASLIAVLGIAVFYLPVIHLFAETRMPGSRVTDLMIYGGFVLSPLFLTLPLAFIFMLLPFSWVFYSLATLVIFVVILVEFVQGVRINYHLNTWPAILVTAAPVLIILFVPLIIALLTLAVYA